ncbi:MAG: DNA repair protein RecN [Cyanobacteriota bacterium]|nr:DNA repair protein RecN [Cyanobacteriota bacterium]
MLLSLRIENFALIDRLDLDFGSGLNVLTGETGAGKSIILDALHALLGGKVSGRAIRTGASRASIEAIFALNRAGFEEARARNIQVRDSQAVTISRELWLTQRGCRSKYRIDGVVVNQKQMQSWRDVLVEITAQGQTVLLGKSTEQRELLDLYGGALLFEARQQVAACFATYQSAKQALEKRMQSEQQRLQQLDLFAYQLEELQSAQLGEPDELDLLQQEAQRLAHVVELQQQSYQVYQALYQNDDGLDSAADLLGTAQTRLQDMVRYDNSLEAILEMVDGALVQVMEAGQQINSYGDTLESDPQRLTVVEGRIAQLKQICRKYGPTLAEAIELARSLQAQLDDLNGTGLSLEELEETLKEKASKLTDACAELTQLRQKTACQLEARLVEALKPLAMEKVQFQVEVRATEASATGADRITFCFSANPGEPLQPLSETASGGEMSRFLLALKACFGEVDAVGTLVFDEIDAGVSGKVAGAIAEKLHQLCDRHQVLCVTHQPLIAAMADKHFRVDKQIVADGDDAQNSQPGERTVVRVRPLDFDRRRRELAELAGGGSAREALTFADALLSQASDLRHS